jgi:putative nucleotidyltransferase with HDIG domain
MLAKNYHKLHNFKSRLTVKLILEEFSKSTCFFFEILNNYHFKQRLNCMKKIKLENMRPGTLLDGKISHSDGHVLFPNKTLFTKQLIDKLKKDNVTEIIFEKREKEKTYTDEEKREEDKIEKILAGFHYGGITRDIIRESAISFRNITYNMLNGNDSIDFDSCKNSIFAVYEQIKTNPSAIINLLDIKTHDDYTYCHSINVGIISLALAQKMGYDDETVKLIGLGGFLHDIGKIAIPASLINKTSVLSEEEKRLMKSHPSHSYRIMSKDKNIHPRIVNMAYEHHERFDGKGYPRGISGDKLDDYSVIVGLADVYDALTTVRSYKPAFSPEESISIIGAYTGSHFAPRIAEKFINDIQNSLNKKNEFNKGSLVLLDSSELAQIVYLKNHPDGSEIVVNLLTNSNNHKLEKTISINLKEDSRKIKRSVRFNELDGDSLKVNLVSSSNL